MKKIKIFDVFLSFFMCFILHNLYSNHPSFITSIFSPVNESIFEHMKLFLTTLSITTIFDYIVFKKKNIPFKNIFLNLLIIIIFSISTYLIIFIPIYYKYGKNFIFTIILLFIVLLFSQILSYYIYKLKEHKVLNYLSLGLIILIYIMFTYLSYNPIYSYIFFDELSDKYGVNYTIY